MTHDQREGLRGDTERIRRWFDTEFDRDGAHAAGFSAPGSTTSGGRCRSPVRSRMPSIWGESCSSRR